jgi:hypothetical protein
MHVTFLGVAVLAGLLLAPLWTRASAPHVSREALASSFDTDMRHVVYEWDPGDPRPRSERRQALFDFMYQTFQTSAWIPQSLFDSNLVSQAVVGDVDTIVGEEAGLVLWRDNRRVPAFGMAPKPGSSEPLRWTVNCLVCHTAEIDGVAYLGAGTKVFDELWLGEALKRLTGGPWRSLLPRGSADAALAADANRILNSHHHDKIDSLTRARSTAFAASHVELYMRPHGGEMPGVADVGRGDVKTPPLWHTAAKMPIGRWYTDGSFHGPVPLMASSMELEKDRPFDALMQVVVPTIKQEFDDVIRYLRPPRYPYAIDRPLAARGRELFCSPSVGCSRCHGVYDGLGNVQWRGVHADVGTDRSRIDHLLGPQSERPKIFQVMAARKLDRARVGQPAYADPRYEPLGEAELLRRFGNDRDWFNTTRPGCANVGHDVWPVIRTDANRRALIEYLKTL